MNNKKPFANEDGINRRGFLECMRWAGTGLLWTMTSGVAVSKMYGAPEGVGAGAGGGFSFAQISDSHMGFAKPENPDVAGTLQVAIDRINALPTQPAFIIHTGDVSHLSKPEQFDKVQQMLRGAKTSQHYFVPGEHDVLDGHGKGFLERFGKDAKGDGWYSFDSNGVHFVGLVNVMGLGAGGLGNLGTEQLAWLEKDLADKSASTPIVVFAHVPLWTVYQEWGWGTADGTQVLTYLRRFGSVSILNGHIHQNIQKVEGQMLFHTAASTAFPQPHPGSAPSPGPMKVPAEQLRTMLGLTSVSYVPGNKLLAVTDQNLADGGGATSTANATDVKIDNFTFNPTPITVAAGTKVTWVNHDDIPHTVVSVDKAFESPVLDTDQSFDFKFAKPGTYRYVCSLHPHMTGNVIVKG